MKRIMQIVTLMSGGAIPPTLTISLVSWDGAVAAMQILASEEVIGFAVGDITITAGGSLANFATADNITFTVDWTPAAGANTMDIAAEVCEDLAGNSNTTATQFLMGAVQTLTLQTTGVLDTYLNGAAGSSQTTNFGTDASIRVGDSNSSATLGRTLIDFGIAASALPANALITTATASLYTNQDRSSNARSFKVYRIKRAWVVGEATWIIWATDHSWLTAGGFHADDCEQTAIGSRDMSATETIGVYLDWTLTPKTKAGLDLGYGWLIMADTETNDQYSFQSTDTGSNTPKLVINYRVSSADENNPFFLA